MNDSDVIQTLHDPCIPYSILCAHRALAHNWPRGSAHFSSLLFAVWHYPWSHPPNPLALLSANPPPNTSNRSRSSRIDSIVRPRYACRHQNAVQFSGNNSACWRHFAVFVQALVKELQRGKLPLIRANGPFGCAGGNKWGGHQVVVIFAGGIGVSM